ncbi:divergent protein kinase domain 2B [Electrophorus electricus]|uniref:FAM69 protein-kinase domain-containing protein n=1 Tax=Electrophorus electricus TaxID=8005 RepID=A0AAY5F6J1_ELEEL|nr:divergent protein kinase domain 2B [Electrophorus electricus]
MGFLWRCGDQKLGLRGRQYSSHRPRSANCSMWRGFLKAPGGPDHGGMAVSGLARAGTAQPWLLACFLLFMPLLMGLNPSASTQQKSNSFGRQFLGLDKCSVCVGTSICKKLLKEEIRFEKWLPPRLPPADRTSYEGTYTDDSESWRPVVLSRLVPPHLQELADRGICRSVGRKACSIEAVLRATPRFQSWARSNLLQPGMVQGLATPMLRCPSQRLLDRIVRRYFEVADVGSAQMKHFASKDKLRLLYTLAVSQQPLIQQMFPGTEGWPFPRYHGSCGRLVVWAASRPLTGLYASPLVRRADAAYQLLHTTQSLASNSLRFNLYYTRVSPTTFGITEDGRLSIMDASNIGIIDLQDGFSNEDPQANHTDVFSCLSGSCERPGPCTSVRLSQSFTLLCRHVLPELLLPGDVRPGGLPARAIAELAVCADPKHSDQRILKAVHILKKALQPFRPCNISYGYRYPECRYSDEF